MITKKEKLDKLDQLVLDRMIEIMEDIDDDKRVFELSALSVPMNYLKNNQIVEERGKSTIEEDNRKRLEEAKKRRGQGKAE